MNKKADGFALKVVVVAILVLFVLVTMLFAFEKPASKLFKTMTQENLYNSQEQCRTQGQRKPNLLQNDNDEYPNTCDICPWYDSSLDADADYMPDGCDKDPDNAQIFECKYGLTEKGQCAKEEEKAKPSAPLPLTPATPEEKAKMMFETAQNELGKGKIESAYTLLKDVLSNYKTTAYYDDSFNEFVKFEGRYKDDEAKLLQFYRDMVSMGFTAYQEKMALAYNSIIKSYAYKKDFTKVESFLRLMEADMQKIGETIGRSDIIAEIYYAAAGAYLDMQDRPNANKYYKKIIDDFPNFQDAESAQLAYSPPVPIP